MLSKELAEIKLDIPLKIELGALTYYGVNRSKIEPLFDELGFTQMRTRVMMAFEN